MKYGKYCIPSKCGWALRDKCMCGRLQSQKKGTDLASNNPEATPAPVKSAKDSPSPGEVL